MAGLGIANIDPEQAAADYRERTLAPYRGVLPHGALASMEEQLSGACTVEIAAFNEFTTILTGDLAAGYDRVLFDTAPMLADRGHQVTLWTTDPAANLSDIKRTNAQVPDAVRAWPSASATPTMRA